MRWLLLRPGWGLDGFGDRLLDCEGPFGANSCMRSCCSAAFGHKADTLVRNLLKLFLF